MEKVKEIILNSLPTSAKTQIEKIIERLEDKGVDSVEDLKYIKFDEDFKDILKDVPARKLKEKMDIFFNGSSIVPASCENESPKPNEGQKFENWLESYSVPLNKFPRSIVAKLTNKQCLNPREYRDVVRALISDILYVEEKPTKRQLEYVARKFVKEFPAMQDCIDGVVIGSGYDGLTRRLVTRVENAKRPSATSIRRKATTSVTENFSCPNFLPDVSSCEEEALMPKKEQLQNEYLCTQWNMELVLQLMGETFPIQRLCAVQKTPIIKIKQEWPFLFISKVMIEHFNKLMKKDVLNEYEVVFSRKLPELYSFLSSLKNQKLQEDSYANFVETLCSYFEEDVTQAINIFEKEESIQDIKDKNMPITPFIAVFGRPSENENNCILIIEGTAASEFVDIKIASLLWFVSFYIFNLEYPLGCPATAEFIQRACFGINPEKGTKCPKRSKRTQVNNKVQKLVDKLCHFKSLWTM